MSNTLSADYRGLNIRAIASKIDQIFDFSTIWESAPGPDGGSYEYQGRIHIDLSEIDKLCEIVDAGPGDRGQVFRYVFAHLKAHHFQEMNPTYDKSYEEDMRPYEIEADLVAGWICANAQIPNAFRTHGMAPAFNDFRRLDLITGKSGLGLAAYPWPEERELAFRRGARIWAAGQISQYSHAAMKQGMADQTFHEFMAEVPTIVMGMSSRPVPKSVLGELFSEEHANAQNRVPIASGSVRG